MARPGEDVLGRWTVIPVRDCQFTGMSPSEALAHHGSEKFVRVNPWGVREESLKLSSDLVVRAADGPRPEP